MHAEVSCLLIAVGYVGVLYAGTAHLRRRSCVSHAHHGSLGRL